MKTIRLAILIFSTVGTAYAENLFEIYKTIPAKLFKDDVKHNFYYKKGDWYTTSVVEEPIKLKPDLTNGYLRFSDEGTGGGVGYVGIALFLNADGEPMIVQTSSSQEGLVYYSDEKITFLKRRAGKWTTAKPLPKIDRHIFFPGISKKLYEKYQSTYRVLYNLPRFGTDLAVTLHIDYVDKYPGLKEAATETVEHKDIREARKVHKVIYSWNKETETFTMTKKCRKNECENKK